MQSMTVGALAVISLLWSGQLVHAAVKGCAVVQKAPDTFLYLGKAPATSEVVTRLFAVRQLVELAKKVNGIDVLASAEAVRDPLSFIPRVVEIQHQATASTRSPSTCTGAARTTHWRAENSGPRCGRS